MTEHPQSSGPGQLPLQYWEALRPEVQKFALVMEWKLRQNEHKNGWSVPELDWLMEDKLEEEVDELQTAAVQRFAKRTPESMMEVALEAGDVGNIVMMVADLCDGLDQIIPRSMAARLLEAIEPLIAATRQSAPYVDVCIECQSPGVHTPSCKVGRGIAAIWRIQEDIEQQKARHDHRRGRRTDAYRPP